MKKNAILITGAGQRVGYFLAKQFLKTTDYPVVFTYRTYRTEVAELEALGATAMQCDFSQAGALETCGSRIKESVSSLRAIIHNASIWLNDRQAPIGSDLYAEMFKVHVDAPLYFNQALADLLLVDQGLKDIISISDASVQLANDQSIAYLASKAALQNLSQNFAKKYAPNIKVNDIAPGLIQFNEGDSEEYKAQRLAQSAIPIEPGAEVIWQAVNYLMNSPYTTGVCLPLEGGRRWK